MRGSPTELNDQRRYAVVSQIALPTHIYVALKFFDAHCAIAAALGIALTTTRDIISAARRLIGDGIRVVVVSLGAGGALLIYAGIRRAGELMSALRGSGGGAGMQVVAQTVSLIVIAGALAFLLVGAGLHTTQTAGLALATDLAPEAARPRVVALLYVMLLLGMILEVISVILITVPIVLPLLASFDISPIHYAIILVVNMELALLTPPVGLNLFVLSGISKASMAEVIHGVAPFIALLAILLLAVTFFPALSLSLPGFFNYA